MLFFLRYKRIYFIVFIFLLIPSIVVASEKMSVICHNEGEYVICDIDGNSDYEVVALETNISYSSNLNNTKICN